MHLLLPGDALFQSLAVGGDALVGGIVDFDFLGEIVVEPLPELGAESGMLRAVGEIHGAPCGGPGSNARISGPKPTKASENQRISV